MGYGRVLAEVDKAIEELADDVFVLLVGAHIIKPTVDPDMDSLG